MSEFLKNENEHIFTKQDNITLEKTDFEDFKKIMNTLIPELVDISIKSIFVEDQIFSTPFNKHGVHDNNSYIGECKYPFKNKYIKKYVYQERFT